MCSSGLCSGKLAGEVLSKRFPQYTFTASQEAWPIPDFDTSKARALHFFQSCGPGAHRGLQMLLRASRVLEFIGFRSWSAFSAGTSCRSAHCANYLIAKVAKLPLCFSLLCAVEGVGVESAQIMI